METILFMNKEVNESSIVTGGPVIWKAENPHNTERKKNYNKVSTDFFFQIK